MKQKWIALAVLGAMLVQVAPISSMTAAALETAAISDVTATDAALLKYNKHDTYVEITGFRADETDIVLPDTIEGLPVTTIQEGAFFSRRGFLFESVNFYLYSGECHPDWRNCLSGVCRFAENRS